MEDPKIRIGFSFTNETGEHFSAESEVTLYEFLGDTALDAIAEQLNHFLRQIGYYRPRDYILLEDLTGDEYEYLVGALDEYRNKNTNKEDD